MDTTEMSEWPPPTWGAAKLEESRQAAARGGGLSGTLSRIRLLAEASDLDGARQELDAFVQALDGRTLGSGELRQIIPVALLIHAQRSALNLLDSVFPSSAPVIIAVTRDTDHATVLMQIEQRSVTYFVGESLFRHDQGESLLQRLVDIYPVLASYVGSHGCENGIVPVNLGDAGGRSGLTFCGNKPGHFLIPDSIFMDTRGYHSMREYFAQNFLPWERRSPIAFWRGSTTGSPLDRNVGWRSLPRIRLCEIGAQHPDLIDAGITKVGQIDDAGAEGWIRNSGLMRPYVAAGSFQQYKYQIDIDGNTTSWPGLFMKLQTGSVVLKVPPRDGFEQWFYDRLRPWINFIPLAADMSDLVDKVQWLRGNDVAARTIGEAGYHLAENLTYEREVRRAVPTVAAAMRDASAEPFIDLDFSIGGDGAAQLREGWMPPDLNGVDSAGFQSHAELSRPCGIGGFILRLDVSPVATETQRLSIAINGKLMAQRDITARRTFHIPLARAELAANSLIGLTFLHPHAVPAACASSPGNPRLLGIRLHRIAVLGSGAMRAPDPDLAEAVATLRLMDHADHAHDLVGSVLLAPPHEPFVPLYTAHGTLAYADLEQGRLRHGPADAVPHNLVLARIDSNVVLLRVTPSGEHRTVLLRPEGPLAAQADRVALDARGRAERFTLITYDRLVFGLGAAGMVLCAEPSGELKLARTKIGRWEQFRTTLSEE
jgi:glycosyl transferase family 90